ncbi:hypothetical protein BGZ60DRAFT_421116 [Tricladium varicosporioides]|nr:hypothetical protein BGZ60DRAFT_421116 [Hymenoscyphus varicosporioides]
MDHPSLLEELLLEIVKYIDIQTLQRLCLVKKSIHRIIKTYQSSISSHLIKTLFPISKKLSFELFNPGPALQNLFAFNYRLETANWLSAVAYENYETGADYFYPKDGGNISASDSRGDRARASATLGWSVRWRLADISTQIILSRLPNGAQREGNMSTICEQIPKFSELEHEIKRKQLEYVTNLSHAEALGFRDTERIISAVFADRVFDTKRAVHPKISWNGYYQGGGVTDNWLNWLVLREGPNMFKKAWGSEKGNMNVSALIKNEWEKRSKRRLEREINSAKVVEKAILSVTTMGPVVVEMWRREKELFGWAIMGMEVERVYDGIHFRIGRRAHM